MNILFLSYFKFHRLSFLILKKKSLILYLITLRKQMVQKCAIAVVKGLQMSFSKSVLKNFTVVGCAVFVSWESSIWVVMWLKGEWRYITSFLRCLVFSFKVSPLRPTYYILNLDRSLHSPPPIQRSPHTP